MGSHSSGTINSNKTHPTSSRRWRTVAVVVLMLAVSLYPFLTNIQVSLDRIKLLQTLATSRDPYDISLQLGQLYTDAGEYDKAVECYRQALLKPTPPFTSHMPLWFDWVDLIAQAPFNPNVHFGYAELFEKEGNFDAAEMEYRRALTLSPENKQAETRLANVRKSETLEWLTHRNSNGSYHTFKTYVADNWHPPKHNGCLVTRCVIENDFSGIDRIEIVGPSGSSEHDQSVVSMLKSAPYFNDPYFKGHVFDCGCLSDGQERLVVCDLLTGSSVAIEPTPEEYLTYCLQHILHTINQRIGALRL